MKPGVGDAAYDWRRMSVLHANAPAELPLDGARYQPGVCNIGPAEIARRRRSGHVGVIATVALFAVLVLVDAPPWARFSVALPAALAASGYLQAALKFCVAFGIGGVFNFGKRGDMERIENSEAKARDRARSVQMLAMVAAIGATVGVVAVVLPV